MKRGRYQPPLRSEGNEFSLRMKPPRIEHFQAGASNGCSEERNVQKSKAKRVEFNKSDVKMVPTDDKNETSDVEMRSGHTPGCADNMLDFRESQHRNSKRKTLCNGCIVWGKFLKTWLPGVIFPGPMAGQKPAKPGWTWLIWLQDLKITLMGLGQVVQFADGFRQNTTHKLSSANEIAIVKALQICADRAGIPVTGFENVKRWGLLDGGFLKLVESAEKGTDLFTPKTGSEFPSYILIEIEKLRREVCVPDSDNDEEEVESFEHDVYKNADFCLSCAKHGKKIVYHHPLFEGNMCNSCKLFCSVCGGSGQLYVCEENDCGRTFCVRCMRRYLSIDAQKLVQEKSPWTCFLCNQYSIESHGALVPRADWEDELVRFFNPEFEQVTVSPVLESQSTRKLRVLSLFDGMGYVKVALDQLHLDIEKYFAVESDVTGKQISNKQFKSDIVEIGDFNTITREKLKEICPIDLVVARPPTEDLDITNRDHEGFNGSGWMMFKVLDMLKTIQLICKGTNTVYWLVETTATMMSEYKTVLSNLFEREPCMWDAQFFSPIILPKYYWGNIPALYSSFQFYKANKGQVPNLDSYIMTHVHRSAEVKRLRGWAIVTYVERVKEDQNDPDEGVFSDSPDDRSESFERILDLNFVGSNEEEAYPGGRQEEVFVGSSLVDDLGGSDDLEEKTHAGRSQEEVFIDSSLVDDLGGSDLEEETHAGRSQEEVFVDSSLVDDFGSSGLEEEEEEEIIIPPSVPKMNIDDSTVFTLPVKMNGKDVEIWPTEVEKLLGLPIHYTDTGISFRKRQKELMKASSIDVLKHVLTPLKETFSQHS
ncbi:DNA (cytosine-5)-methyltransferase 3A-like isoform X2 [Ruditapes philippinarum]|uniref:DNA (cytosine-5)-methyltransferase 3A-like isoform X2 n=1 Tax=Ruditapes philippinarum TaxID=129788 RepID=UPI00295AC3DA|nr:DNA (cytosine-5)-methyltransferase 3A-like isoform X2 [Ruditapes philippinarum]